MSNAGHLQPMKGAVQGILGYHDALLSCQSTTVCLGSVFIPFSKGEGPWKLL